MARELGVRNLTAFKLQSGGTYGTAIPLENCIAISTTNNYREIEYYSDCKIEHSSSTLESVDVEIETSSDMDLKLLAEITGQNYSNGKLTTVVGSAINQLALAYEVLMVDGTTRRRVLYSLNLKKEEQSNETQSAGETWTLTGKALPIELGGKQYVDMWMSESEIEAITESTEKTAAKAEYAKFFTSVVLPS